MYQSCVSDALCEVVERHIISLTPVQRLFCQLNLAFDGLLVLFRL